MQDGGGLVVLGETEQDKYGNNINELLERFGLQLRRRHRPGLRALRRRAHLGARRARRGARGSGGDLLAGSSGVLLPRDDDREPNGARVLARAHPSASVPGAPLMVASDHGDGRVVVVADSDLFGDDCIGDLDHAALWMNIANWTARARAATARTGRALEPPGGRPSRSGLRDETNPVATDRGGELARRAAAPDGVAAAGCRRARLRPSRVAGAGRWPHGGRVSRTGRGRGGPAERGDGGYGKPDFTRALAAFRPEQGRQDGIEHLVVLPDVQAERLARHVLRGGARAGAVA